MSDPIQEHHDRFYFNNGPCCAGCDHWRSIGVTLGECTKSAPVSSGEREAMLGVRGLTMPPAAGHVITERDHICGDFEDEFDWSTLPLPYLKRVGAPSQSEHSKQERADG